MTYRKDQIAAFESYVQKIMDAYEAPGLAVALAEHGKVTYQQNFGTRDQAAGTAVDGQTIFGLASVTKSFTALAIMQLAEQGLLSLNDPVTRYLPEFKLAQGQPADAITIHHLITHTAGFPPLPALDYSIRANTTPDEDESAEKETNEHPSVNTMAELLDYIATGDYQMLGQAGEFFSYSNDCYGLLGEIIERVSGQPYTEYVQQHILQPLGMQRSMFTMQELLQFDNVTELYYRNGQDELIHSPNWQVAPPFTACGWLKSCADDLIKYAQMYANGGEYAGQRLLSEQGVKQMQQVTLEFNQGRKYGYGLIVKQDYAGVTLVEHGGSLKGVSSNMGFAPEKGIAAIVLCNLTGVPVAKIWLALINLALGLPIEQHYVDYSPYSWTADMRESVMGEYSSGEGAEFQIEQDEAGELTVKAPVGTFKLQPIGPNRAIWRYKLAENEMRFLFDETGKAWAIHAGGRVIRRVPGRPSPATDKRSAK